MIDGKPIHANDKATTAVIAPDSQDKQDIAQTEQSETLIGDPIPEQETLDLSLGDLNPPTEPQAAETENKDALNENDPQPKRKVTGKKRRMGRRRMPSGAE